MNVPALLYGTPLIPQVNTEVTVLLGFVGDCLHSGIFYFLLRPVVTFLAVVRLIMGANFLKILLIFITSTHVWTANT